MLTRVMGLETEYGIALSGPARNISVETVLNRMFLPLRGMGASSVTNHFLETGGRVYVDVGSHPEYATPELSDALSVIIADAAGDALMSELAAWAQRRLGEEGLRVRVRALKNNSDAHGNTYGCHENYLIERGELGALMPLLQTHLATRSIYTGAGKVVSDERGSTFVISDRARFMANAWGDATTRDRPLINGRDEPHADPSQWRRLHVICGDALMSQEANWLKLGTTHLVLRLGEERGGRAQLNLLLRRPVAGFRQVSQDLELRTKLDLATGGQASALEIQLELVGLCEQLVAERGGHEHDHRLLRVWRETLELLKAAPDELVGRVDWITKRRIVERLGERDGAGLASAAAASADLLYHEVGAAGMAATLRRSGRLSQLATDNQVREARKRPPGKGRALARAELIAAAHDAGVSVMSTWDKVSIAGHPVVSLSDPFGEELNTQPEVLAALGECDQIERVELAAARVLLQGGSVEN